MNNNKVKIIIIAFLIAPVIFLFSSLASSNITHRYDIIPSLNNKVVALECTGSGISQLFCDEDMLDLGEFEFFKILPIAKNYAGTESSLVLIIVDLLSCLFVLSIIFAFVIAFKIMVQEMAPWGEESAEKFKRAKNKYLELGKAFIIPAIVLVVIMVISSIFGVKAPWGLNYLQEGLGIQLSSTFDTSFNTSTKSKFKKSFNRCVENNEINAIKCIETVGMECYNDVNDKINVGTSMWTDAISFCNNSVSTYKDCVNNCGVDFRKGTPDYNSCVNKCKK